MTKWIVLFASTFVFGHAMAQTDMEDGQGVFQTLKNTSNFNVECDLGADDDLTHNYIVLDTHTRKAPRTALKFVSLKGQGTMITEFPLKFQRARCPECFQEIVYIGATRSEDVLKLKFTVETSLFDKSVKLTGFSQKNPSEDWSTPMTVNCTRK